MLARALLLPLVAASLFACSKEDRVLKVTGVGPCKDKCPPMTGDVDGGTYVVIKGNAFMQTKRSAKVYFGSRQGTVERFQSDTELIVRAPGGKPDEVVDVLVVFEPGGQLKIENAFKYIDKPDVVLDPNDLGKPAEKK